MGRLTNLNYIYLCKFATVSSSELDTITLLEFLSYTLSLLRLVDGNQLTGPIPSKMGSQTRLKDLFLGKFATISSSELDTKRLLGSISQFIFYGLVDNNVLTGNLDPLFCNITDIKAPTVFVQLFLDICKHLVFVVAASPYCTVIAKIISYLNGRLHGISGGERRRYAFN
jgi:hypothetical protein